MCRFVVYKGKAPIRLSDLVTKPIHSITNQTFDSKLRFPSSRPFNADGFGIGYYEPLASGSGSGLGMTLEYLGLDGKSGGALEDREGSVSSSTGTSEEGEDETVGAGEDDHPTNDLKTSTPIHPELGHLTRENTNANEHAKEEREQVVQIGPQKIRGTTERVKRKLELAMLESERPGLFKSIHPAWSNANLIRLAEKIQSPLVFAHVRASTMPGAPSEDNCHPWTFGKLMWMHNGAICDFHLIKRKLQASLTDELFLFPNGYTDSEWAFALFLCKLSDPHARTFSTAELRKAMLSTLAHINLLTAQVTQETGHRFDPHLLNFVVSDGENVVATRYVSSKTDESASLFFSSGTTFEEYAEGGHYRMTKADKREDIVMIASEPLTFEQKDWMEVKNNTMVVITPKMNVLQIPIMDEFYVPPHIGGNGRSTDYAIAQGYGHGFMRAPAGGFGVGGEEREEKGIVV